MNLFGFPIERIVSVLGFFTPLLLTLNKDLF